ncbi:MAG: NAD-binding protein, partial [Treponema sp.]|nr:NAD-binding protein [Treponema sp.]
MKRTLGFIGLGVMGQAMARNLARKYPGLLVFDADPGKTASLPGDIAEAAPGIAELGRRADLVFLSLPGSAVVREVLLSPGGLAEAMAKGGTIVDTSTTEVTVVKALGGELEKRGLKLIDAPVSGGEKAALEGTLSFMVGADPESFEALQEYLCAMGTSAVRMGPAGTGQIAKAANQMIVGAAFAAIAESFALGVRNGLDGKTLYEAIKGGWAGSKVLDVAAKDMFSREFKPGGTVDIHWKDLGYALNLARDSDVPTPVTAMVHEIFKAARAGGEGKKS